MHSSECCHYVLVFILLSYVHVESGKPDANTSISEAKLYAEEKALVLALRDTFLPRLQGRDASIFATLLTDIWPHLDLPLVFGGDADTEKNAPISRASSRPGRQAKSEASVRSLKGGCAVIGSALLLISV